MDSVAEATTQLDWLLAGFLHRTPGTVHALVASGDGLRIAASARVDGALADQLAAAGCGLAGLANGAALLVGLGPMMQTIIELENGHIFVTQVADRAMLTVVADRDCDIGMIGYEMTALAGQVGRLLSPAVRRADPQWRST